MPVFMAGEGKSEEGYCRWLSRLAVGKSLPIHIRAEGLSGSDPLDLIEQAVSKLSRMEYGRRLFIHRSLLLDADLLGKKSERDEKALQLADKKRFSLIWQKPSHEGFILHHFREFQNHRPPDQASAEKLLNKAWRKYCKGMDADGYGSVLTLDNLAIARSIERDLDKFLNKIGWQ